MADGGLAHIERGGGPGEALEPIACLECGDSSQRWKLFHGIIDLFDDGMKFSGVPNAVKRLHSRVTRICIGTPVEWIHGTLVDQR